MLKSLLLRKYFKDIRFWLKHTNKKAKAKEILKIKSSKAIAQIPGHSEWPLGKS